MQRVHFREAVTCNSYTDYSALFQVVNTDQIVEPSASRTAQCVQPIIVTGVPSSSTYTSVSDLKDHLSTLIVQLKTDVQSDLSKLQTTIISGVRSTNTNSTNSTNSYDDVIDTVAIKRDVDNCATLIDLFDYLDERFEAVDDLLVCKICKNGQNGT